MTCSALQYSGSHYVLDFVEFDTNIFGFLLLPVIIFSSAFNMEHHATIFFFLNLRRISLFAVVGTTIAIRYAAHRNRHHHDTTMTHVHRLRAASLAFPSTTSTRTSSSRASRCWSTRSPWPSR